MDLLTYLGFFFIPLCSVVHSQTATSSPECKGIDDVMNSFKQAVQKVQFHPSLDCNRNDQCTGFSCHGSVLMNDFHFNMSLIPCTSNGPALQFEGWGVKPGSQKHGVMQIFHDKDRYAVFDYSFLKVFFIPTLKRKDNTHIIVGGTLEYCIVGIRLCKRVNILDGTNITVKPCVHTVTLTVNQECSGMEKLTEDLQKSLNFLNCSENIQCSGFHCQGNIINHKLSFNITLDHCSKNARLLYSGHGVSSEKNHYYLKEEFKDGDRRKIIDYSGVSVYLITNITRQDKNHILLSGHLDKCESQKCDPRKTVVDKLSIFVNPCPYTGTSIPPTTAVTTHRHYTIIKEGTTAAPKTSAHTTKPQTKPDTEQPPTTSSQKPSRKPVPTANQECNGMEKLAEDIQKNLRMLQCAKNSQCTGSNCHGNIMGDKLSFNITLDNCSSKPKLVYSGKGVTSGKSKHVVKEEFYDGDEHEIINLNKLKINLHINIKRQDKNHVLLNGEIALCKEKHCQPSHSVVDNLVIAVKPCHHPDNGSSDIPHKIGHRHGHNHASAAAHHGLSSGALAGIIISCLVIVTALLVGFWYWKKGRPATRLRAAYYNNISMNDPLYDDFDPVDA